MSQSYHLGSSFALLLPICKANQSVFNLTITYLSTTFQFTSLNVKENVSTKISAKDFPTQKKGFTTCALLSHVIAFLRARQEKCDNVDVKKKEESGEVWGWGAKLGFTYLLEEWVDVKESHDPLP
ncbi:CLUMA_CG019826, isoform A [Clunio marinus]|uniref:CLUMA_CG019826, isoform A n=1 Tax=Clunio marinus TaxID=568069 RepID=A0A1J1J1S5_9DIPT|nr:CLUMA_CG019826, isoform A [Clunio marinus]